MHNDPELNTKFLGKISSDFVKVADHIKEASYQIRKRSISEFPIFTMCDIDNPIGGLLLAHQELGNEWFYKASFLEEFVQRLLIEEDKIEDFKHAYKDADEFCCLFVINKEFTNFVFIPYPED